VPLGFKVDQEKIWQLESPHEALTQDSLLTNNFPTKVVAEFSF
jgi:hypothetical protein